MAIKGKSEITRARSAGLGRSHRSPMQLDGIVEVISPNGDDTGKHKPIQVQLIIAQGVLPAMTHVEGLETLPDGTFLCILNFEVPPGYSHAKDPVYTGTVIGINDDPTVPRVPEPPRIQSTDVLDPTTNV